MTQQCESVPVEPTTPPGISSGSTHLDIPETSVDSSQIESYRDWLDSRNLAEVVATDEALLPFYGFKGHRKYERFSSCRETAYFARSKSTGRIRVMGSACRDRWCIHCARARAAEVSGQVGDWLRNVRNPRILTLTLQSSKAPLIDQLNGLYKLFRQWRLRPDVKSVIVAGIWFMQVTMNSRTKLWHPHLHCLIVGKYKDKEWYSTTWKETTKTSYITDIRAVKDQKEAADYVGRYVARPALLKDFELADRLEIIWACHSRRLFGTWGRKDIRPVLQRKGTDRSDWQFIRAWSDVWRGRNTDPTMKRIWDAWRAGEPVDESVVPTPVVVSHPEPRRKGDNQQYFWDADGPINRHMSAIEL